MSRTSSEHEKSEETPEHCCQDGDDDCSANECSRPGPDIPSAIYGSVVEYYGSSYSSCGYCKREAEPGSLGQRKSFDMQVHRLTVDDYQELLDRGWRRCGTYAYYPINWQTCCPNYPISCKASQFKLTRSQRRCIEKLNSFLLHGSPSTSGTEQLLDYNNSTSDNPQSSPKPAVNNKTFDQLKGSSKARDRRFVRSCERKVSLYNISLDEAIERVVKRWVKARYRVLSLEDYLYPKTNCSKINTVQAKHRLEIKMCHVNSRESRGMRKDQHNIIMEYQRAIHKESESDWTMTRYCGFLVKTPLVDEPIRDRDYVNPGHDNSDRLSASVCDNSSSEYALVAPPDLPTSYGTYHCSYHLDGKLIAVGVLDVLPKCVTTVYFFYDPNYGHLNLGIYSALVEISIVRRLHKHFVGEPEQDKLIHYYLGFYVHECKKMHYKTSFRPSYLLCSETCQYVPTEVCLRKLENIKYARFSMDTTNTTFNIHQQLPTLEEISAIRMWSPVTDSREMITYFNWLHTNTGSNYVDILVNRFLVTYIRLIGPKLPSKLCLRLHPLHRALLNHKATLDRLCSSEKSASEQHESTDDSSAV